MTDPWTDRLSEYLDGELSRVERRELWSHLAGCEACATELDQLRELLETARELPDTEPEEELFPGIAARLGLERAPAARPRAPRLGRWPLTFLAAAAGALVTALLFLLPDDGPTVAPGGSVDSARFLLLLREPPEMMVDATPEEVAAVVRRYQAWAGGVAATDHLLAGEKLAEDRAWILPPTGDAHPFAPLEESSGAPERVSGFFIVSAADFDEARRIASDCPHLDQGGWVELRRIEEL